MQLASVIDFGQLGEIIGISFLAGIGITIATSITIYGSTRYGELYREGRHLTASLYLTLAIIGLALFVAGIVTGIVVMTTKS